LVWRDPSRVVVRLTDAARTTAPGGAFGFLGAAGSPLWQIPQTQKDGVVWLGWNTEELSSAQISGGVDWKLEKVDGPGRLAIFEFDSFGQPKVLFDSGNGLPDTYRIPLGTHAHGNWSFTKPGTYKVRFTHTATLTTGKQSTDSATLTFEVGSSSASGGGAPAAAPLAGGGAAAAPAAGGCRLATTGGSVGLGWVEGGVLLVVLGTVLLVAVRRRVGARPAGVQSSDQESGGAA
jgi:putative ABC transporter-associated repeat protein